MCCFSLRWHTRLEMHNCPRGIERDEEFFRVDATGTVVHFESRVPTEWETKHLTVILITADSWDPTTVDMSTGTGKRSREDVEMYTIRSLTSSMSKRAISAMLRDQSNSRQVCFGKVE